MKAVNTPLNSVDAIAWLRTKVSHYECEDCWYSCATLTCDEHRKSDQCDCGADEENEKREQIARLIEVLRATP